MKKLLIIMLMLLLVVPATKSFSDTFVYDPQVWSEHRYYDDTSATQFFMIADAIVDTNAYNVYVQIPAATNQYKKLSITDWFGYYDAYKFFRTSDGYSPPGASYENIDYNFFIDTNANGALDLSDPSYPTINIPSGTFTNPLPLVDNVEITYVGSNTIVSWNGIPLVGNFGDDGNDLYKVRIINRDTGNFVFDSGSIAINSLNQYELNLGNLSVYGENLYIGIEAREGIGDVTLANRSRYYASASQAPVPEPATMLLLGTGLVGLAGFGRKKFKK